MELVDRAEAGRVSSATAVDRLPADGALAPLRAGATGAVLAGAGTAVAVLGLAERAAVVAVADPGELRGAARDGGAARAVSAQGVGIRPGPGRLPV